jgi:glucosylceramidase
MAARRASTQRRSRLTAASMCDVTAAGFSEGAAFHCYGGDASAMTTFHEAFPTKSVYMTECSGGTWQGDPFGRMR